MNCYSYNEAHGIAFHSDYSSAYDARDPITSLSMVNGSLLIISAKSGKKNEMQMGPPALPASELYADHGRAFPEPIPARSSDLQ